MLSSHFRSTAGLSVVVAGLDLNGLGVVRALGRAGVPVVAIDTNIAKPTAATRFGTKVQVCALSGLDFVSELLLLRQRFNENPVLLLTQEASVVTVSMARHILHVAYRFTLPPDELVRCLQDKLQFQALAEAGGFPIPRAVHVTRAADIAVTHGLRFPCVVKPLVKDPEYDKRFAKAYKTHDAEEVVHLWSAMRKTVEAVIVQEWIEGDNSDIYFCLQYRPASGAPSVSFVGRKLCQWPLLVGGTASCIPAPEVGTELTALTDRFFGSVGLVGIGSMEYKRDSRDGQFYMVEPTVGRTDYQEEVATLNGVNIPLAACYAELGVLYPHSRRVISPCAWREPMGSARALVAGAPDPRRMLSPHTRICDAYFRADDPMPYVAMRLQALRKRFDMLRLSFRRAEKSGTRF